MNQLPKYFFGTGLAAALVLCQACHPHQFAANRINLSFLVAADPARAATDTVNGWTIATSGCASGSTPTSSMNTPSVNLFSGDRGCSAKLTTITINGQQFTPKFNGDFTTTSVGSIATFLGTDGTSTLQITITKQLSSPLLSTDTAAFIYQWLPSAGNIITSGTAATILPISVGTSGSTQSGGAANFNLYSETLAGTVPAQNTLQYTITVACTTAIGTNNKCNGTAMTNYSYALVENKWGSSAPCASKANCDSQFNTTTFTTVTTGNQLAASGAYKGGFNTATLTAPSNLASHSQLMLVLKTNSVYEWLDFTVATSQSY